MPILTPSSLNNVTCQSESKEYVCTDASTLVQWIAAPFVNATGSPVVFDSTVNPGTFQIQGSSGDIVIRVRQISGSPHVTAMTVSGNVLQRLSIVCIDRINGLNSSKDYISGGKIAVTW